MLADAYLEAGQGAEARVIAEDLVAREPWEHAHIDRFRRALVMLGVSDPDTLIADRLSGQGPFVATDPFMAPEPFGNTDDELLAVPPPEPVAAEPEPEPEAEPEPEPEAEPEAPPRRWRRARAPSGPSRRRAPPANEPDIPLRPRSPAAAAAAARRRRPAISTSI